MAAFYAQGKYKATIEKWGLGESKTVNETTGVKTPCVFFVFIPQQFYDKTTGEWQTVDAAYERRIDMWISENTIEFVSRDLNKLGYPHDTFDQLEMTHPKKHDFYGQEIEVQCKHDSYTDNKSGQKKEGEKWSLAFEGGSAPTPDALESRGVRKLNSLFGKQLKQYRQDAKPEPAAPPPNTEEEAAEVF